MADPASLGEDLKRAVVEGDAERVRALLEGRAEVNHKYVFDLTPLHLAAVHNHPHVARVLQQAGAEVNAKTSDEAATTPANIAWMSGHTQVLAALKEGDRNALATLQEDPPVKNPMRRRFCGPLILVTVIAVNVAIALCLTRPDAELGGHAASGAGVPIELYRSVFVTLACVSATLLAVVNSLDPGSVYPDEVRYVEELALLGEDSRTMIDDETFTVSQEDGSEERFRWCHPCQLWRPRDVSHCSVCRRCFWRFDHHCDAVGNCIAAKNHAAFALMVLSGASAWLVAVVSVGLHLHAHNEFSLAGWGSAQAFLEWPLVVAAPYMAFGSMCSAWLFAFGTFHTSALFFKFNTKMLWRPKHSNPRCACNDVEVMAQIFTEPPSLRACSEPRPVSEVDDDPPPMGASLLREMQVCGSTEHAVFVDSDPERERTDDSAL